VDGEKLSRFVKTCTSTGRGMSDSGGPLENTVKDGADNGDRAPGSVAGGRGAERLLPLNTAEKKKSKVKRGDAIRRGCAAEKDGVTTHLLALLGTIPRWGFSPRLSIGTDVGGGPQLEERQPERVR